MSALDQKVIRPRARSTMPSTTMKEAQIGPGPTVAIVETPIPSYSPTEVLIKVIVAGSNPKDWKHPTWFQKSYNSGDDLAGIVHAVGSQVIGFRPGDRVAALHRLFTPGGAFAAYAVAPQHALIHLPPHISFEQAATLPLASATAALALFPGLGLPMPWTNGRHSGVIKPSERPAFPSNPFPWMAKHMPRDDLAPDDGEPLLVYGAATAVGAYAIQFAKRAKSGRIIAVAGNGIDFVKGLLDEAAGDVVVDYRQDPARIASDIEAALQGTRLRLCFDAVSAHGSHLIASSFLKDTPRACIVTTNPETEMADIPPTVRHKVVMVIDLFDIQADFAAFWAAFVGAGLAAGWFRPHPFRLVPGGLDGVREGLEMMQGGKVSACKLVFRLGQE